MNEMMKRASRSVGIAAALIGAIGLFCVGFLVETFAADASFWQECLYVALALPLVYGAFAHALSHLGYVLRLRTPRAATERPSNERVHETRFGALIPTYREQPEFVYRAMLSVALQRHDEKWLRLLVDDPPSPTTIENRRLLLAARGLPDRVRNFMRPLEAVVSTKLRAVADDVSLAPEALVQAHRELAAHLAGVATDWPEASADDRFFCQNVLTRLAEDHLNDAECCPRDPSRAAAQLARLRRRFQCDVAAFERKRYANLSHAVNKAMNLNVAIDFVGRRVSEVSCGGDVHLREDRLGRYVLPEAAFLLTLDADSLLAPDYAVHLLGIMVADGAERVAVVQAPYAALPEASTLVERVAGATTDVQRILHQGFARFEAAFWVGANAILRVAALRDIATEDDERGHRVRRYIQDRTPIEDTESTLDLAKRGWLVHNEDAILAWSATPKDFGSLVIQRRRWACGGLILLPKAVRAAFLAASGLPRSILQFLVRSHYLGSLFWSPAAVVGLLFLPFDEELASLFLPLVALPYFVAYGLDLVLAKRRLSELLPIYCLNLMLIPVNLAGALASLRQAVTGKKAPFARTPKVEDRIRVPVPILMSIWAGVVFLLLGAGFDAWMGNTAHALFAGLNGGALLSAVLLFVGLRDCGGDLLSQLRFGTDLPDDGSRSTDPTLADGLVDSRAA